MANDSSLRGPAIILWAMSASKDVCRRLEDWLHSCGQSRAFMTSRKPELPFESPWFGSG